MNNAPNFTEVDKELEKLLSLDVMSYSTMSGHPQCKVDPFELRTFLHTTIQKERERWEVEIQQKISRLDADITIRKGEALREILDFLTSHKEK